MIPKIKRFFVKHYLALILAVIAGFLMILPQIIFMAKMGGNYTGINISATDSESNFLSRYQEIGEGDWGFSDIFLTFNKKTPYSRPFLEQVIMYRIGRLFFLNVRQSFLFAKFLLPVILFLTIYFLVLLFEEDKRIALSVPFGVIFWYGVSSFSEIKSFFANHFIISEPSVFSRPFIPISGMIILFLFLYSFYLAVNKSSKKHLWFSGILLGLSFYVYFYAWSFLLAFMGVSFLWFLWRKDWPNLMKIIKAAVCGAVVSLPYWFDFYKIIIYKSLDYSSDQAGMIFSKSPIIGGYLIISLVLYFLAVYFKRIKGANFWFWTSLIISLFVVLNQQIITHRILQPGHYHWYIIKPITIVLFIWLFFDLIKEKGGRWLVPLIIIFFISGFYLLISQQIFVYQQNKGDFADYSQRYGPVFQWLNQNTQKNQIIFSGAFNKGLCRFASGYIHLDEYLYLNKSLYPSSSEENKLTLFFEYKLNKITPAEAKQRFFNDLRDDIFYRIYGYYYRINYIDQGKSASDQQVKEIFNQYADFYRKDIESEFREHPIDYIIWDKRLNPNWGLDNYNFLELIHQEDDIRVYKFAEKNTPIR